MTSAEAVSGNIQLTPVVQGLQRAIAGGQLISAIFGTEAGTSLTHPNAEVTADGDGFVLNGHKIFGTLSPVATMYFVPSRMKSDDGSYESVMVMLGKGTPGVEIRDNWDAMGMRGSGSGDVVFKDVRLTGGNLIRSGGRLGEVTPASLEMTIAGNVGLIACFAGIAEAAADIAVDIAKKRRKGPSNSTLAERHWMQHLVGEMMADLENCRGMLSHAGRVCDEFVERYPMRDAPLQLALERTAQFQSAKYVVNRKAIDVVDKALTVSGGAGYMTKHPLSRLYRDVRAGPFMQPYAPPEAIEFIGRVTLEQDVTAD
jgi:alkylation response protein AidB-like acyl-CoA dehydrogenase